LGALESGHLVIVGVLMVSSLLNVAYLLEIPFKGFFAGAEDNPEPQAHHEHDSDHDHRFDRKQPRQIKEAPLACLIAISITSAGCLILFFYPDPVYNLMRLIVAP